MFHLEFKRKVLKCLKSKEYDIVIMEGFLSFFDPLLTSICDVRIHIKCSMEVAAERRLRTQNFSPQRYAAVVWPNYLEYEKVSFFLLLFFLSLFLRKSNDMICSVVLH